MDVHNESEGSTSKFLLSRRNLLAAGGAVTAAAFLAACSSNSSDSSSASATAASDGGAPSTPPEKPAKIVMRAWGEPYSTTLAATAGATFTKNTGIPVEFDLTDFGEMKVKIEQAFKAGERPFVDVAYTTAPDAFIASQIGYTQTLDTQNLVTNYSSLSNVGKPDDGTTNWVNIYSYTIPVLYRTDLITFPSPMGFDELWNPKYKGQFTINIDPNVLVWPMAKMMGLDPAIDDLTPLWARVAELKPNLGAIWSSDSEFLTLINSGQVAFSMGLPGNAGFIDNGAAIVPTGGVSLSGDSLYIPKGLPDNVTYWSQVFVNEVIGAQAQTEFCKTIGAVPTNVDATLSDFMVGNPVYPFTDAELAEFAIPVINSVYADNRDQWIEAMTNALQS